MENHVETIPYAVLVREIDSPNLEGYPQDWKWEAKIEELGLLTYGPTKRIVFQSIMNKYKEYLSRGR